ncbi:Predicted acetyltransferase, GNAT superfamily [Nonomuraea solani]|uniref:Predicted acetyltransferase, GNAT superfamily n=1 Tax=Nonomuraea solani TaxID=1144553 RepID=A0A1H5ZRV7_9ACTN|nr:GNAT family N-acetyltransferase [Nonomuraea solani]SEG38387.1 Predicted acetyltransferase, GNAT superfamily [Nonomuraea solani]
MGSHQDAAAAAGVVVRELREIGEFKQVYRLFDEIWHPEPRNVPAPVELMIGFAHTGNYVAGAFDGDTLVGASVGFLAADRALHSHVTGAAAIGRGVGYVLKQHQRTWCLERGLDKITWTFDPLVRRNARFNLVKLGARPEQYLADFYGVMADAINEGDASDRLLAVWRIGPGDEGEMGGEPPRRTYPLLWEAEDGRPVAAAGKAAGAAVSIATPSDVETLRRTDPEAAKDWRTAVREALGGAMEAGGHVVGFTDRGEYVVLIN